MRIFKQPHADNRLWNDEEMEKLRQRLARLMREKMRTTLADTQTKVAAKAGVSQSTVQRLLSLEQAATLDLLESLSKAFGVKRPEYLLLDPDEAKLLTLWETLGEEDRTTVLGFIQMKAQTKSVHHTSSPLSFETETPVSAELVAASKRAAARKPAAGHGLKASETDEKTNIGRARRKA